jgi:hypothetical protein
MNENWNKVHLSSKEISQYLVEGPSQQSEEHLQGCWSCQAKLAEARDPLTAFRTAVVAWSDAQPAPAPQTLAATSAGHRGFQIWLPAGLALAAMVLAGVLFGGGAFRMHPSSTQKAAVLLQPDDAVLMEQVDAEVSEAVPDAMAPLTDMVAWNSDGATVEHAPATKHSARVKHVAKAKEATAD